VGYWTGSQFEGLISIADCCLKILGIIVAHLQESYAKNAHIYLKTNIEETPRDDIEMRPF